MSKKHHRKKDRLLIQVRMQTPPAYPEMAAEPEPEPTPMPEASISAGAMTVDAILGQLASIKDHALSMIHNPPEPDSDDIWEADVHAIEAATAILSALQDEGIEDTESLKDLIFDYELSQKEIKELHRKFIEPENVKIGPDQHHGVMQFCPECGGRLATSVFFEQFHCGKCGKRIFRPGEKVRRTQRRESL